MENKEGDIIVDSTTSDNSSALSELSNSNESKKELRAKRLLERLRLSGLDVPKINSGNTEIDLSQTTDDDSLWLQQRFPTLASKKKCGKVESAVVPGKVPSKLVKISLRNSLRAKTRAMLERRRELYNEDNQDIFDVEEDEEPEYEERKKKKVVKPVTESDEENDDDWVEDESGSEEGSEDDEAEDEAMTDNEECENVDDKLKKKTSDEDKVPENMEIEDKELENCSQQNEDELTDEISISDSTVFPTSLSQWFNDDNNEKNELITPVLSREMKKKDPGPIELADDELLNLCSGRFESQAVDESDDAISDEEDVIIKKKSKTISSQGDSKFDSQISAGGAIVDNEEASSQLLGDVLDNVDELNNTKRVVVESDVESDDEDVVKSKKANKGSKNISSSMNMDPVKDNEDADEEEEEIEDEDDDEDDDKNSGAGSEDDELAEYNRFLKADHKRKLKKDNFFDDEASLSGDDVGSDPEEEEENDEYEMEEGDNDDLPDAKTIQLQNHKHLMKQELQKEHRAIVRLQERLLADGDLGGIETNRTFRVRLRDEADAIEDVDMLADKVDEDIENDEDILLGTEALKMKLELEQAVSLNTEREISVEEDALESAGLAALTASASFVTVKKSVPSLLNKAPLAALFKETTGSVAVKQLYTSNVGTAATKRVIPAETAPTAKRKKAILLDVLTE